MGNLLHLHDAHEQTQRLLPWRVNGTLEPAEAELVDAHLAECAECRSDHEESIALRVHVASMPVETQHRWPEMRAKVTGGQRPAATGRWRSLRRPVTLGWALAAQAAVAATFMLFFLAGPAVQAPQPEPGYRLLGAPAQSEAANLIVLFAPETTQRQLQASLGQAGGRVVDGPTASGAYLVRVPGSGRDRALAALRAMPHVALAEPIDSGGAQ